MALRIDTLKDARSSRDVFVSARRLLVTADDEVVEADDPRGIRLLVGAGSSIPMRVAEAYGLVEVRPAEIVSGAAVMAGATFNEERDAEQRERGPAPVPGQFVTDGDGNAKRFTPPLEDKSRTPQGDKSRPELLDGTVAEVQEAIASIDDIDELATLLAGEEAGKNRRGVLAALDARRAELEG